MTYSIVARDPITGFMGVAVQSHYFAVGRVVTWAEAGVGAVATQSIPEPAYGPRGLDRMRNGDSAPAALEALLDADPLRGLRQVAMLDANGETAVHTGDGCLAAAGHAVAREVSVQANLMERNTVWRAMLRGFEDSQGRELWWRLLAALEAAECEGGDLRGKQSAALLVVSGSRSEAPWAQRLVDLRVDDHPDPLAELRRLLDLDRAFDRLGQLFVGGLLFEPIRADAPELERALGELEAAQQVLGANREPTFWQAVLLAKAGRLDDARERLRHACETNPRWPLLIGRLVPAGILSRDAAALGKT